jgi:hypothetical protein
VCDSGEKQTKKIESGSPGNKKIGPHNNFAGTVKYLDFF